MFSKKMNLFTKMRELEGNRVAAAVYCVAAVVCYAWRGGRRLLCVAWRPSALCETILQLSTTKIAGNIFSC